MAENKILTVLQLVPALESGRVERGTLEVGREHFPDIQASRAPTRRESLPALRLMDNPG